MDNFERFKEMMTKAYQLTGAPSIEDRMKGLKMLAKALQIPLREGVMFGDILGSLFTVEDRPNDDFVIYPLDPIAPGTEKEYVAFTISGEGDIPTFHNEGDYVACPTYEYGFAVSWLARYAKRADWGVLARMMEVAEAATVKKRNDDGFRLLIAGGVDRNIIVSDTQAAQGQFTKKLVSNGKVVFTRNGGGNSTSVGRRFLTTIYQSPEQQEDMRNWGLDQVDDFTRREIYLADDNGTRMARVFNVDLVPVHELGEGQEYQQYYTNELAASLASGDVELMIGVNMTASRSFLHPVVTYPTFVADPRLVDIRKAGLWGMGQHGFALLDQRDVLLLSS